MKTEVKRKYYENGSIRYKEYLVNGKTHREDGPAFIEYSRNGNIMFKIYYIHDERHRIDGPAYIVCHKDGSTGYEAYYIKGKKYTKDEFLNSDEHNRWLMEQEIIKELS